MEQPNILCIEHDEAIRVAICDYLEHSGFPARQANCGKDGLARFREQPADLTLVDLRLTDMNGWDVLSELRRAAPDMPLIAICGKEDEEERFNAIRVGAAAYLAKPVEDLKILMVVVNRCLERVALFRQNREYKEMLERLLREKTAALAELELANNESNNFAHIVSHDLKSPLRGISQLAYWFAEDYAEYIGDNGRDMLTLLLNRVKRMDNLINGILQYSRIGRGSRKEASVDVNLLLKDLFILLDVPAHIHIHIPQPLPVLFGEEIRIEQLFQNLVDNAIKFMNKPEGNITISSADTGEFWTFCVEDDGPGIDPKYHEKIFQMFQTLTPRDEQESTGIGLTIAKKIVEFYGGRIWLESAVGNGCKFFFTLPKSPASTQALRPFQGF